MDNYNGNTYARQDTDMSVGSWIGTLILSAVYPDADRCGYYNSGVCHHGRRVSGVSAELRQIPQPGFSRVGGHLFFQH